MRQAEGKGAANGAGHELDELTAMVKEAVREVLSSCSRDPCVKLDGSWVTDADTRIQALLQERLARSWPGIPMLGEEMTVEHQQRLLGSAGGHFWCVDPLDGTSNFVLGIPFYATSIALVERGRPRLAVVFDPVRGEVFSAERGRGAFLDGRPLVPRPHPPGLERSVAVVDFKRLDADLSVRLVSGSPARSLRNFGACALEWCWLAAGRVHLYLHGGMKLWDLAAGSLILDEAGGRACDLQGRAIGYRSTGPLSVVAACDPGRHAEWVRWLEVSRAGH